MTNAPKGSISDYYAAAKFNMHMRDSFLALHRDHRGIFEGLARQDNALGKGLAHEWRDVGACLQGNWDAKAIAKARFYAFLMRLRLRLLRWSGLPFPNNVEEYVTHYVETLTYFLSRQERAPAARTLRGALINFLVGYALVHVCLSLF